MLSGIRRAAHDIAGLWEDSKNARVGTATDAPPTVCFLNPSEGTVSQKRTS